MRYIPIILVSVILSAGAQLFLKNGMTAIGPLNLNLSNILTLFTKQILFNSSVLIGLALYILSAGVWLIVLSKVEVSFAYPMVSLAYVVTAIIAKIAFHENLSINRIIGILIVCLGVFFIARS